MRRASFEEDRKGRLRPGLLADVAVFDTDLVDAGQANPRALLDAEVMYTIVGGEIVYAAPAASGLRTP